MMLIVIQSPIKSFVYKLSLLQDFDFHDQFLPVNSAVMIPW